MAEDAIKKILLYLGKFPGYGFDIDGGSILARQLINTLKKICVLDVVFIRKNFETFVDSDVRKISYVTYKNADENKFSRRLKNLDSNRKALENFREYDIVITAHVSKFFGMEIYGSEFWDKTILFPMFCTRSYKLAGETVPIAYTDLEHGVIRRVKKIITPSEIEREDLIRDCDCEPSKIKVIPRSLSPLITRRNGYRIHEPLRLVYIASIKKQKNHLSSLDLLRVLKNMHLEATLHLVFTIQEKTLYEELREQMTRTGLESQIVLHEAISQAELAKLLREVDINISLSTWETFGRGIFEGMAAGLPTFVLNKLVNVRNLCEDNRGICFSESVREMAQAIFELIIDATEYKLKSDYATQVADKFSCCIEREALRKEIFS